MKLYPLKLSYIAKTALWGGSSLKEKYNKPTELEKLAESWELSVREKEKSVITNGSYAGKTLEDYIKENGNSVVSQGFDGKRFPLLIKFIDAADTLSVQVHPDDEYARTYENDVGKTEMWYILDAEPDATLIYGLADGVDEAQFCRAVDNNECLAALRCVSVKKGDVYFIPSKTVHAIGKGIIIAEIQQNCDLTYRVYDYDRVGADGKKRELHKEKAKAVVSCISDEQIEKIRFECMDENDGESTLAHCRYFKTDLLDCREGKGFCADARSFASVLCIEGNGEICFGGEAYPVTCGDSYFIPAGMGEYSICGDMRILHVTL